MTPFKARALRYALLFFFEAMTTLALTAFGAGLVASLLTQEGSAIVRYVLMLGGWVTLIICVIVRGLVKAREESDGISQ